MINTGKYLYRFNHFSNFRLNIRISSATHWFSTCKTVPPAKPVKSGKNTIKTHMATGLYFYRQISIKCKKLSNLPWDCIQHGEIYLLVFTEMDPPIYTWIHIQTKRWIEIWKKIVVTFSTVRYKSGFHLKFLIFRFSYEFWSCKLCKIICFNDTLAITFCLFYYYM